MPDRGVAFFESWRGGYADSPRALSETLPPGAGLRRVWAGDGRTTFPAEVAVVRRHSPAYFARLAGARVLVANDIVTRQPVKGPRVRYLQTWHGTPLKRIGLDESTPAYAGAAAHLRRMRRDVGRWDFLVSSSPECTEIFRSAFGYRGQVLETGSPRNDVLRGPGTDAIRRAARARLGLREGTAAVLYAPTWRDDRNLPGGGFSQPAGIDVHRLRAGLPEDTVLLTRMHRNVARGPAYDSPGFAVDVSTYPSVAELYLAADVLVSDYSSVIYDFAVTGKPIVLFPYDLVHYVRAVRGLYFDYGSWAPGPIVETSGELARELTGLLTGTTSVGERYAAFVARFCPWEDGGASSRVWQAVLA
jgi:CDP-glycerol glycerophosphotransferase